jgi:acyl-CoA synthetase (AMP-forming)/AMP-acid ligase II/pimeloyl-ACP methyl ester carboxylesterase
MLFLPGSNGKPEIVMPFENTLRKLMPYESHFVEVGGYKMHYLDEGPLEGGGDGPAILLLHGNPTWCFYFRHLIAALRPHFRVIAPDYIGCGLSDHPQDAHFRASHRIEQMNEFVDKLGLDRFALVMHDWGGSIGTGLAIKRKSSIAALVYLNTTLTETELLPRVIKLAANPLVGKFLTQHTRRFLKLTTEVGVNRKLSKDVKKGYFYPYRTRKERTAIWDFVADIPFDSRHPSYSEMLELAEGLPDLGDIPVQIVWGLKDICFHREMLNKVAEQFPHAQVLEIADASHLVLEDAPDLANSTIVKFFDTALRTDAAPKQHSLPDEDRPNSFYEAFLKTASAYPHNFAVISPSCLGDSVKYEQVTYRDLYALVCKYERGLNELGLGRGDKVLMLVSPGVAFIALSYAVMGRGAIPFYLDPGMGLKKLTQCIEEIDPDVFIGSPRAHILRLLKRKLLKNIKFHITAADWMYTGGKNLGFLKKFASKPLTPVGSEGLALVAFTSGATGTPKGVVFTDEMIQEQLRIFKEVFGLEAGARDLPLLPIFSLYSVALGVSSVFAPIDPARPLALEPARIVKIVNDLGVRSSFGSPTLWRKIAEYCVRSRSKLPSLEKVFMAGAPVPPMTLERMKQILENGVAFTPYGATEALPVTLISADEILGSEEVAAVGGEVGTLVGAPLAGIAVKIVKAFEDEAADLDELGEVSVGEIGEILVQGANISPEYYQREESTRKAKLKDGNKFWHRMGDLGYFDSQGRLYFCGRKVHAVISQGRTYYSVPVERVFNALPKVYRSALVALGESAAVGVVVEPYPEYWPESEKERLEFESELRKFGAEHIFTAGIEHFFFHRSFPVDGRHNAKIFRDQLSCWANEKMNAG